MAPVLVPRKYKDQWERPWSGKARRSWGFRKWLWECGYVSPHFTRAEWACHDGSPVPNSLRKNAQRNAFNLEVLRHRLGDVTMPLLSAYRTDAYNRSVHGARDSRHVQADAADFSREWVDSVGRARVQAEAEKVFSKGGVGTYPAGSMHFDSRGTKARWTDFVGW